MRVCREAGHPLSLCVRMLTDRFKGQAPHQQW